MLHPGPIGPLLNVRRGMSLSPRIDHPVGKNEVRNTTVTKYNPGPETVVLPKSTDDYRPVAPMMLSQPGHKPRTEAIPPTGRSQCMDRDGQFSQPRRVRPVKCYHFRLIPRFPHRLNYLSECFVGAAHSWVKRPDYVQEFHTDTRKSDSRSCSGLGDPHQID